MKLIPMSEAEADLLSNLLDRSLRDVDRVELGIGKHVDEKDLVSLSYVTRLPSVEKGQVRVPLNAQIEKLIAKELEVQLDEAFRSQLETRIKAVAPEVEETLDPPKIISEGP